MWIVDDISYILSPQLNGADPGDPRADQQLVSEVSKGDMYMKTSLGWAKVSHQI